MTTTHDDDATTWRDLADQLTPDQFAHIEHMETTALSDPPTVAAGLLEIAREHAQKNLDDDAQFGHLPIPVGARKVFHWEDDGDGCWTRQFSGMEWRIGANAGQPHARRVGVDVEGVQRSDGSIERTVYVYANGAELTAVGARALAAAVIEAADELDRLK